jgi:hypothetical protein
MKTVKKCTLFVIILFTLAACRDEEEFSIVGNWQQECIELFINSGIQGEQETPYKFEGEVVIFTFRADGTGSFSDSENMNFIWNLNGKVLTIRNEEWSIPGYELNLTTMTQKKLIGEQTINKDELLALIRFIDPELLTPQMLLFFFMFPNLSARIQLTLNRIN